MLHLLLGLHNHQPIGNFNAVLERALRQAYQPFLDVVAARPSVRLSLHCSGILYDWLEEHFPSYLDKLAGLVKEGRVELLSGGYYEPILASLPEKDQKGQIERMQGYLKTRFGVDAPGFWLAERVWEPHLPKVLEKAGLRYTIVDDTHFLAVGFSETELRGYFLTEAEGHELRVFPISQRLRYMIPYSSPEEVIEYLRSVEQEAPGKAKALVMADDGEKFGLWPSTHDAVFGSGWLEKFLTLVEQNSSWLKLSTFSDYLGAAPPLGWAYLPTTAYSELSEWALRPEPSQELGRVLKEASPDSKRFIRGGYFRNFLTKYPEANRLYRKMLRVSKRVHDLEKPLPKGKTDAKEGAAAREFLWKGQCNCAYWHGVFGGLYLPHLRRAVYENLIKAESAVDRAVGLNGQARFEVSHEDWDADGGEELIVESGKANWYFAPKRGAGLWEWDLKARGINLSAVVSRRKEAYHDKAAAAGAGRPEQALEYDWHGRMSLLDHFLHPDTTRDAFASARYGEQGDFVLEEYAAEKPREQSGRLILAFEREGRVWSRSEAVPVRVRKEVTLGGKGDWSCAYEVENLGKNPADLWFGSELAFAFSTPDVCPSGEFSGVGLKTLQDGNLGVALRLRFDVPLDVWSFPLYTISQSEEGFDKTYQGSVLLAHKRARLAPGQTLRLSVAAEAEAPA